MHKMGQMLAGLLRLQAVERDLAHVRAKLDRQKNAVAAQERRIQKAQAAYDALHTQHQARSAQSDQIQLDLQSKEEHVSKLRSGLNQARTNKEYAAILTEINTFKADNAKLEEQALKVLEELESSKQQVEQAQQAVEAEAQKLQAVTAESGAEVQRLTEMLNELQAKRDAAAAGIDPDALYTFDRLAERYDGEAMALIEVSGKPPRETYVCGGCFMGLRAEHVNALQGKDEIRTCDNCARILYLAELVDQAAKSS